MPYRIHWPVRSLIATIALVLAGASATYAATPLDAYRGNSRVLVVSAPSDRDRALATQNRWLQARQPGLRDRDVVVMRVVGNTVEGPSPADLAAQALRAAANLPADEFGVALIGKDGSEAFRQFQPIKMATLFERIDAMPMRREEIARHRPSPP